MKYTKEIIINKDITTVFEKLTDPEFMEEWQESLDSYEKNSEGNWVYTDSHSGKPMRITEKIIEKDAPTKFFVEYTANGVINTMNNSLQSIDEGTTKWVSDNKFVFTNIFMKVIGFLFGGTFSSQTEKDMQAFKESVENL